MNLDGEQLVLDTNILVHWLRGGNPAEKLNTTYELGTRRPHPIVPVVVRAEIKSLALQLGWGNSKIDALETLLRRLPIADISSDAVIDAYARLDHRSRKLGRRMGKNDLWIAAIAAVQGAVLMTTDRDFEHFGPEVVKVHLVDPAMLLKLSR